MDAAPDENQEEIRHAHASMIAYCRQRLAQERARRGFFPSALTVESKGMTSMPRPSPETQQLLLSHGKVVWAHIIQANSLLFKAGPLDLPAWVVFGDDPFFDGRIDELERIGTTLYGWKENDPPEPENAQWADRLKLDAPFFKQEIPAAVCGGRRVHGTWTMVFRDHLPGGILVNGWFPYLVLEELKVSMILPSVYWPPRFAELWRADAVAAEDAKP